MSVPVMHRLAMIGARRKMGPGQVVRLGDAVKSFHGRTVHSYEYILSGIEELDAAEIAAWVKKEFSIAK